MCPFRALDEFDVFMDPINRRQSMQLILDNYKEASRSVQYIFITPQSLRYAFNFSVKGRSYENRPDTKLNVLPLSSHICKTNSTDFSIHLLPDPERSNTTAGHMETQ